METLIKLDPILGPKLEATVRTIEKWQNAQLDLEERTASIDELENLILLYMDDIASTFACEDDLKTWLENKDSQNIWRRFNMRFNYEKTAIVNIMQTHKLTTPLVDKSLKLGGDIPVEATAMT